MNAVPCVRMFARQAVSCVLITTIKQELFVASYATDATDSLSPRLSDFTLPRLHFEKRRDIYNLTTMMIRVVPPLFHPKPLILVYLEF